MSWSVNFSPTYDDTSGGSVYNWDDRTSTFTVNVTYQYTSYATTSIYAITSGCSVSGTGINTELNTQRTYSFTVTTTSANAHISISK